MSLREADAIDRPVSVSSEDERVGHGGWNGVPIPVLWIDPVARGRGLPFAVPRPIRKSARRASKHRCDGGNENATTTVEITAAHATLSLHPTQNTQSRRILRVSDQVRPPSLSIAFGVAARKR